MKLFKFMIKNFRCLLENVQEDTKLFQILLGGMRENCLKTTDLMCQIFIILINDDRLHGGKVDRKIWSLEKGCAVDMSSCDRKGELVK